MADFLNKVPELIFEAKTYGDELKWKEEQKELDRKHESDMQQLAFNQGLIRDMYDTNQELQNSLSELGIVAVQGENLADEQKTPGFENLTGLITGNVSSDLESVNKGINYLQSENSQIRRSISSYNMGKGLFNRLDINDDGTIDAEEKAKYAEDYAGLDIDYDAFSQGIYASELSPEKKAAIDLSREELLLAKIQNEYLPDKLKNEITLQGKEIDIKGMDLALKNQQLSNMEADYQLALQNIALTELNMEKIESDISLAESTFDLAHSDSVKKSLVEQEARDKINANAIAMGILSDTFFYRKGTVTSLFDLVVAGKADFMTDKMEIWAGEYNDIYQEYEAFLGQNGSIEDDMLAIYNAISMGYNKEHGSFTMVQPFLESMDEIYNEIENIESGNPLLMKNKMHEGNYISDFDIIKSSFELEHGRSVYDHPEAFIQKIKKEMPELSEAQLIEIGRYMQFQYSGFDMETLGENRRLLDSIRATNDQLSRITNIQLEAYDLGETR